MYRSIKALYRHTESCVRVNAMFSGWFFTNSGVRQGDSLSPTLFALFINRLAEEIKQLNKGVDVDGVNVSILLYADDIVLISGKETDLQHMLDYMKQWCFKWKLKLNVEKSKIVHFRRKNVTRTEFPFHFGENELEIIDRYKYLGIIIDEYLNYDVTAQMLSDSAGRALGEGHKEGVLFTVHEENKGPFTVHEENKSPITVHEDNKHIYSTRVVNS